MTRHYDLAIIGAGPAGSALAMLAARAGTRVLLVEKSRFDKRRPGETASPECCEAVRSFGFAYLCAPPFAVEAASIVSVWGEPIEHERPAILSPFGASVQLDRQRFDAVLADAAADSGATVVPGVSARVMRDATAGQRLDLSDGTTVRAGYIAICDGRHSTGAGMGLTRLPLNDHICLAAELDQQLSAPVMFVEAVPQGWLYGASLPAGRAVLALTTRRTLAASGAQRSELWIAAMSASILVRQYLPDARPRGKLSIWNSRASAARKVGGADWCLLGDSRFAMDPLSGRGLEKAFADARIAADHLAQDKAADLANALRTRSAADLEAHTRATIATYGCEQRFAGQAFW